MTTHEKQMFRYQIVKSTPNNIFDFEKNFYELDWYDTNLLAHYAEIFHIKGSSKGWSPARTLWYQLQKSHEDYANITK